MGVGSPIMSRFKDPKTEYIHTDASLVDLAENWKGVEGCSLSQLAHRSSVERWVALRERFRIKAALKTEERISETVAQMNVRYILDALDLRDKVMAALKRLDFESASEIAKALKIARDIEREARGQGPPGEVPIIRVILNGNGDKTEESDA
jgi:hypothetical protein